ncbi:MAG: hypothetical protein IPK70_07070 [Flavobacteriales bacterium]|jgi:hypothetical protein|nr:hypothetical protein [Flavobacteriales bacterium]
MDWLGFVMDNMGHFAPQDILLLLFRTLCAAALGAILARVGGRMGTDGMKELALWAAAAGLAGGFAGAQLPLAVLLLAFAMLMGGQAGSGKERALRFSALVLGLGCGSAPLVAIAVGVPFALLARWAFASGQR